MTAAEAKARSATCPQCDGSGLVPVYDRRYRGHAVEHVAIAGRGGEVERVPIPMHVAAHCLCPMGAWLRQHTSRELLDRIPSLADVLDGRTRWTTEDPR
jgi:hypothetical protein